MATNRTQEYNNDTQTYDYFINGEKVTVNTFVLSNVNARNKYDQLLKTGLWQWQEALEYAHKSYFPQFYDDFVAEDAPYNGDGIHVAPDGGPENDAEREQRLADEDFVATAEQQRQDLIEQENDWRVRLHLADSADYLYKSNDPGILAPLKKTNGIIFPYTPTVQVQYNADYSNYDLVHSNYRGYFYKGSQVQNIILTATFTANDVAEANYLLASLHFLRTCTKMFYGNDEKRGMPPPVVYLTGLGEYQFNNHPCAITMISYNLPNDVDYIAAGRSAGFQGTPEQQKPITNTKDARLFQASLEKGGKASKKGPATSNDSVGDTNNSDDIYTKATYVPTKIDINFTMIPIQTRKEIAEDFSLKDYASGKLLKKGLW